MLERARELLKRWQRPAPAMLFHYTSGEGLLGILESGVLRGSNFSFMNDRSEFMYGVKLLQQRTEEREASEQDDLARKFYRAFRSASAPTAVDVYLTCFCEEEDLLSQWRGYGNADARYCICFDSYGLTGAREDVSSIAEVIYERDRQIELLDLVFDEHLAWLRADSAQGDEAAAIERATQCMYQCSLIPLAFFKDDSFREEHEWRCVVVGTTASFATCVGFAGAFGIMKPFLPLLRGSTTRLPVTSVIAGASRFPAQAEKAATLILRRFGYNDVCVHASKVPLSA